jgi:hypothetical protein
MLESVRKQIEDRVVRFEQSAADSKVAVAAALKAAESAVEKQNESFASAIAKSEAATTKAIDQQGQLIQTETRSLRDMIIDVKERWMRIEGAGEGRQASVANRQATNSQMVGIIGLILGTLIGAIGIVVAIVMRGH